MWNSLSPGGASCNRRRVSLALFGLVGCIGDPAQAQTFQLERSSHATFTSTQPLEAGTRVRFISFDIRENELLLLQRCGELCGTARVVGSWRKADFEKRSEQMSVISEAGSYYFWIKKELPNGEVGPVPGEASVFNESNGIARFASGATAFVAVDRVTSLR